LAEYSHSSGARQGLRKKKNYRKFFCFLTIMSFSKRAKIMDVSQFIDREAVQAAEQAAERDVSEEEEVYEGTSDAKYGTSF
jgi:hypothetical protein